VSYTVDVVPFGFHRHRKLEFWVWNFDAVDCAYDTCFGDGSIGV
jgi:hypothetical protein